MVGELGNGPKGDNEAVVILKKGVKDGTPRVFP